MNRTIPLITMVLLLASGLAPASEPASTVTKAADTKMASNETAATGAAELSGGGGAAAVPRRQAANPSGGRTRAEVHAEAVEAVKHYRSTFAESLDLYKN